LRGSEPDGLAMCGLEVKAEEGSRVRDGRPGGRSATCCEQHAAQGERNENEVSSHEMIGGPSGPGDGGLTSGVSA